MAILKVALLHARLCLGRREPHGAALRLVARQRVGRELCVARDALLARRAEDWVMWRLRQLGVKR